MSYERRSKLFRFLETGFAFGAEAAETAFCFWYASAHTDSRLLYHKTKNSAKFIFEKILQNLSLTNSGLAGILLLGIIVTVQ